MAASNIWTWEYSGFMDLKVVKVVPWDFNLTFDLTQLLAVGESLWCDYSMVIDYILEINFTKRKKI